MTRRHLLAATAAIAACRSTANPLTEDYARSATLASLRKALDQGAFSSRQLVEFYLNRVMTLDRSGPRLRAVLELNPDALRLADEADRARGQARGPLAGIPIFLKDNIDTADALHTSAGSLALADWKPPADAGLVRRLRAAGAILLGKTNLSEWANFRSSHSSSGWSGRGGQTLNPHALRRNPSGSSSGSAAAVAALLAPAAIGTETDGSIISPASVCGIVGVKPTLGLWAGDGIIPIAHSQDTAGPMTRSVADAALLLDLLSERPHDPFAAGLTPGALRGARLAVPRKFFERSARLNGFLSRQLEILKALGAEILDEAELPSHGKTGNEEYEVLLYEFKTDLDAYLGRQPANAPARSMQQLIDFNLKNQAAEMPFFDQEILLQSVKKGPLTEARYLEARAASLKAARADGIDAVLSKYNADAIVTLSSGPAWLTDHVNGDNETGGCTSPAAVAGYPHVTVPAGLHDGLPIGLSFFGTAWSEARLLRLAYAYEQAAKALPTPTYNPNL